MDVVRLEGSLSVIKFCFKHYGVPVSVFLALSLFVLGDWGEQLSSICDGSKRQTIALFTKVFPPGSARPVIHPRFLTSQLFYLTTIIGGRTLDSLPERRGCNYFSTEAERLTEKKKLL